jgi:hypothetical protein
MLDLELSEYKIIHVRMRVGIFCFAFKAQGISSIVELRDSTRPACHFIYSSGVKSNALMKNDL